VAPARRADGEAAVFKIGMPHFEGAHEIDGLRFWSGDPTVRLLESDDALSALLLERCEPGTPLRVLPEIDQDAIVAALLRRMRRVPLAPHRFRPLSAMVAHWVQETNAATSQWADPGLVRAGLDTFDALLHGPAHNTLLATDLHAGNVLGAQREPWLVIDPKPFIGDPAYDATQHLRNNLPRLQARARSTIDRIADLMEVDPDRVRLWTFARAAAEPRHDWNDDWMSVARTLL